MSKRTSDVACSSSPKSKLQKLTAFGFSAVSSVSSDNRITEPDDKPGSPISSTCSVSSATPHHDAQVKSSGKFIDSWKLGRPWLRYDKKLKQMFCDVCIKAKSINSFTTGCDILKKECVNKHGSRRGNSSHIYAQTVMRDANTMEAAKITVISKSKNAIISAMRNTFFAAYYNLANTIVPKLHQLCITQGATHLSDLKVDMHTSYDSHKSTSEFQQSLADVIVDEMVTEVKESRVYSVMLDESTDVSVHQNLIVYVRYLTILVGSVEPVTQFLGIRQLQAANAESIYSELLGLIKSFGFSLDNLIGVSTDGAAVMLGCKSGVVTRLKEATKGLLATHCIAHRLALGTGAAADEVRYMVKFQDILNNMYKYFAYSPRNMCRLEAIQTVLEASHARLHQVFHTRWLSFEGSVQAVVDNSPALVSVFLEDKSAKALAQYKPIACFKFVYTAHCMADILRPWAVLCRAYQRSDIDFIEVNPLLHSTVELLESLRSESGSNISTFLSEIPAEPSLDSSGLCTFEYKGHTISDSAKQRLEAASSCAKFIDIVIDNLKVRFTEEGDSIVLSALTKLFDPYLYGSQANSSILSEVSGIVSDYLSTCGLGNQSEVSQELAGFVAYARVQVLRNGKVYRGVKDLIQLAVRSGATYPCASAAAERLLVSPVSTVDCERGFSKMNLIKTDIRNKLSITTLENLMRISMYRCEELDFETAFNKWAALKSRRIFM